MVFVPTDQTIKILSFPDPKFPVCEVVALAVIVSALLLLIAKIIDRRETGQ